MKRAHRESPKKASPSLMQERRRRSKTADMSRGKTALLEAKPIGNETSDIHDDTMKHKPWRNADNMCGNEDPLGATTRHLCVLWCLFVEHGLLVDHLAIGGRLAETPTSETVWWTLGYD